MLDAKIIVDLIIGIILIFNIVQNFKILKKIKEIRSIEKLPESMPVKQGTATIKQQGKTRVIYLTPEHEDRIRKQIENNEENED